MFQPREIISDPSWLDVDGVKIYTISARHGPVDRAAFEPRLAELKRGKTLTWDMTPAFAIFHDGASMRYLVLAWWGNDNELFTSVSVETAAGWVDGLNQYSFCLWDLEVFWHERNFFIETLYREQPSLDRYRTKRFSNKSA